MEITQSFIMTMSRAKLSMYEQRILVKIVEHGQALLKGLAMEHNLKKLEHNLDNVRIEVPIRYILSDNTSHYEHVYSAARGLMQKVFEVYDSDRRIWYATPYIYNVSHVQRSGNLVFWVSKEFFNTLYDFTKGYSRYVLETAMTLKSPYSVRMYILMCGQRHAITYNIGYLKELFGVQSEYKQTADFIKRVIVKAQTELDAAGCNSFTWSRVFQGQKVVGLQFFPVKKVEDTKEKLLARIGVKSLISRDIYLFLTNHCGFTYRELSAHKVMLDKLSELPNAMDILLMIEHRFRKGGKTKGYVINALRGEVKNATAAVKHLPK